MYVKSPSRSSARSLSNSGEMRLMATRGRSLGLRFGRGADGVDVLGAASREADQHRRLEPALHGPSDRVRALQRGDDALQPARQMKGIERLHVRDRLVLRPPGLVQE